MKRYRTILSAAALLACTSPLFADGVEIVDCEAPPQGASEEQVKCYTAACNDLLIDLAQCGDSEPCRNAAFAVYHNALALCAPLAAEGETSDDLVIWLDTETGNWEISWPGEQIQAFTPRFDFNI